MKFPDSTLVKKKKKESFTADFNLKAPYISKCVLLEYFTGGKQFILNIIICETLLSGITNKQALKDLRHSRTGRCACWGQRPMTRKEHTLLKVEAEWQKAGQKQGSHENVSAKMF